MNLASKSMRAGSRWLVLAAVATGGIWIGCSSDNGEPEAQQPGPVPTTKPDPTTRPDFEAGFPQDAGNVDPTPEGGNGCVDNDDPGSSEITAKPLPDTDDSVDAVKTVTGVLNGPMDVDFYKVHVADVSSGVVGADIQIATAGTELCAFLRCSSGATNFKGCTSGVEKTSDIGDKGCCTAGPGKLVPSWSCGGNMQFDDSAQFFFRVKQTTDKCLPYSMSYVF